MRISMLLLLSALLTAGVHAQAQAQTMKPGLWELKQQPKLDPKRQAQMEQAQQKMAALPAEQRKMMEEMMAKRGVSMDFAGGSINIKMCVSEEQARRNVPPVASRGNCTHDVQRSGKQIHTRFSCTDPVSEGTSDVTLLDGGDGFSAVTHMTHTSNGKTDTIDATSEGHWLGSDCGGLKPMESK